MKRYLSFAIIVVMTWVQDKKYKSKQEKNCEEELWAKARFR